MFRKLSLLTIITGLSLSAFAQATTNQDSEPPDSSTDNTFVLVPLPCPNDYAYKKAQEFMDQICLHAAQDHYKVTIVRSCYNKPENIEESRKNNWWWDQIKELPQRYAIFIDQGTVSIVDSCDKLPLEYTPVGFFYHKGKLVWNGQLNTVDVDGVLGMFSQN
jgi:hypothetical protein